MCHAAGKRTVGGELAVFALTKPGAALPLAPEPRMTRDCSFSPQTWAAGRDPLKFQVLEHDLGLAVDCGTLRCGIIGRVDDARVPGYIE